MSNSIVQIINQFIPDLLTLAFFLIIYAGKIVFRDLLPKVHAWLEAHTTATQRENIKELGHEAFAYAETVYREKNGADKLHEALAYFQKHMDKYGLNNLTYEAIRASIERAWLTDKSMQTSAVQINTEPVALAPDPQPITPNPAIAEAEIKTS